MTERLYETQTREAFDLNAIETSWVAAVAGFNRVLWQMEVEGEASIGAAVLTIERSVDGIAWRGLATPVTIAAAGLTATLTLDAPYMRVRVSTAAGAAARARVSWYAWLIP